MIDLTNLPWTQGSAVTLLALVFMMFLRGAIVPRSTVDKMLEVRDKSATEWHAAYLVAEETNRLQARQVEELLEIARRDAKVLEYVESALRNAHHVDT